MAVGQDTEMLLQDAEEKMDFEFRGRVKGKQRLQICMWGLQLTMLLLSLTFFLNAHSTRITESCDCEDFLPMWSPALAGIKGTGHYQRFDGSFATPNRFKGSPSPEIDAAWQEITYQNGGVINISQETLRAVNASSTYSVELASDIGGGYMASVEALHQLHCLNMLRQASYWDYYKDKAEPWKDSPQTLRYHLDHCIDNLRQKLMCDADAGILTYVWVKDHPGPFPDFNVQHKCRDFAALKSWVEQRQLFIEAGQQILRVDGANELPTPP